MNNGTAKRSKPNLAKNTIKTQLNKILARSLIIMRLFIVKDVSTLFQTNKHHGGEVTTNNNTIHTCTQSVVHTYYTI